MAYTLDSTDKKILNILQNEGRITTKALAERLNLTTTPVFERIKRLEKNGIISKYAGILNEKLIDRKLTVFISISIKDHARTYVENFLKEMESIPEVMEVYHIAGNYDFLVKVMMKDMEAYQKFVLNRLSVINNIDHVQSSFVLTKNKYTTAFELS
ncbi:Lrp/AsnC family transcriptional regulator [Abyssalbus ytuae]|uniref:Lrp/AsnC family transcriptional regulator n=1 Tax=Abyssalbus ytuae TaxID=2926907 RepID=A0A9E6ZUQ7_9FLAO|nr:Lrp/AsnC family transcriptional regulator [Abyssalbus ytuae]UOB18163.1 Lrp/AsnC family transcriptional regulator [Abyssalbus ytuae]